MNRKKSLFALIEQRIKKVLILTLAISSFAFVSSANAAILDLTLNDSPDISVYIHSYSYDSSSGEYTANGKSLTYTDGITPGDIDLQPSALGSIPSNGDFVLTANISTSGMFNSGSFTLNGDIGSGDELLLSGMLNAVGFDTGSTLLEFEYAATGGALASVYSGLGGIIMDDVGISPNLFATSFSNLSANGVADVGKIPEPLSVLLFGAGLLALGVRQRRSKTI